MSCVPTWWSRCSRRRLHRSFAVCAASAGACSSTVAPTVVPTATALQRRPMRRTSKRARRRVASWGSSWRSAGSTSPTGTRTRRPSSSKSMAAPANGRWRNPLCRLASRRRHGPRAKWRELAARRAPPSERRAARAAVAVEGKAAAAAARCSASCQDCGRLRRSSPFSRAGRSCARPHSRGGFYPCTRPSHLRIR